MVARPIDTTPAVEVTKAVPSWSSLNAPSRYQRSDTATPASPTAPRTADNTANTKITALVDRNNRCVTGILSVAASTASDTMVHAPTTNQAPTASDGRCQPAATTAAPTLTAYAEPATAVSARKREGATRIGAMATVNATVECPLG